MVMKNKGTRGRIGMVMREGGDKREDRYGDEGEGTRGRIGMVMSERGQEEG